jgi:hypothetical protein
VYLCVCVYLCVFFMNFYVVPRVCGVCVCGVFFNEFFDVPRVCGCVCVVCVFVCACGVCVCVWGGVRERKTWYSLRKF